LLGAEGARARADEVYARASLALDSIGTDAEGLRWLSEFILRRDY
jgi:hypothetical protein